MTKRIEQTGGRRRAPQLIIFAAFALLAICQPQEASAQWVTDKYGNTTLATGNVGVGTTAPAAIVDMQRMDTSDLLMRLWNTNPGASTATFRIANSSNAGSRLQFTDSSLYVSSIFAERTGGLRFRTGNASSEAALVDRMAILPGGNVGIGTAAPAAKLDVNGSANFSGSTTVAGRGTFALDSGNNLNFSMYNSFRISAASLLVSGALETYDNHFAMRQTSNNTLTVRIPASGSAYFNQGNVGIGTTTPTTMLHVAGDIRVDGNISAKYQDVAEWVPSTQKLAAGTVVILDIEHNNHVTTTAVAYDTRVAGVVSAQPGISLGEAGEGKALIATTGRVKVRVDATRAPIRVGDLLVTGDTPGVAMRSQPLDLGGVPIHRPGTLIGKALEPLDKGTGEILVLLSLQ
jgi:hypothetical protein